MEALSAISVKDADRLRAKVDHSPGHGPAGACWPWTASQTPAGYGRFRLGGRLVYAHRVAFVLAGGVLTEDEPQVLHRCDNPPCCNAAHLFRGNDATNAADMVAKGRAATGERNGSHTHPEQRPRGEQHGSAKITARAVAEMRRRCAAGEGQAAIAQEFGIARATVSDIVLRKRWR